LGKTRRGGNEEKTGSGLASSSHESFPFEEDAEPKGILDDVPGSIISEVGVTGEQLSTDDAEEEELSLRMSIVERDAVTVSRA
jgi:hypothetical protein